MRTLFDFLPLSNKVHLSPTTAEIPPGFAQALTPEMRLCACCVSLTARPPAARVLGPGRPLVRCAGHHHPCRLQHPLQHARGDPSDRRRATLLRDHAGLRQEYRHRVRARGRPTGTYPWPPAPCCWHLLDLFTRYSRQVWLTSMRSQVGVVGNQPTELAGCLDINSSVKVRHRSQPFSSPQCARFPALLWLTACCSVAGGAIRAVLRQLQHPPHHAG